ncbi:MAG: hypothetical protein R3C30_07110 [Hyphomonadaceae bacterium]
MRWVQGALAVGLMLAAPVAIAQTAEPVPAATLVAPPAPEALETPANILIPAGTDIVVEFVDAQSSRTSQTGAPVALRLAEPIVIDGRTIVPAGALAGGEVIDASRSGMGGRQGKLIISGRFVEINGQRVRIRGLRVFTAGEDNSREAVNTMILVPYVGFMGGFIQGGETEIPAGSRAQARLAVDVSAPLSALPQEDPTPAAEPASVEQEPSAAEDGQ